MNPPYPPDAAISDGDFNPAPPSVFPHDETYGEEATAPPRPEFIAHPGRAPEELTEAQRAALRQWRLLGLTPGEIARRLLDEDHLAFPSDEELDRYVTEDTRTHSLRNYRCAAEVANQVLAMTAESPTPFEDAVMEQVGQQAFKMIAGNKLEPDVFLKMASIFLRVRHQQESLDLQKARFHESVRSDLRRALESFAKQIEGQPEPQRHLVALRESLRSSLEELPSCNS